MKKLDGEAVAPDVSEGFTAEMGGLTAEGLPVEQDGLTVEMRETIQRTRAKYGELLAEGRPAPRRPRMPVAERAKQFAPFAALKTR